jgi:hypothetical protein
MIRKSMPSDYPMGRNRFSPEITLNHTDEVTVAPAIMIRSQV